LPNDLAGEIDVPAIVNRDADGGGSSWIAVLTMAPTRDEED
jgi:hypothetical protein